MLAAPRKYIVPRQRPEVMASITHAAQGVHAVSHTAVPVWLAGAAGLGYVIGSGIENMELLQAPLPGAGAAEIRAAYRDGALATVMAL